MPSVVMPTLSSKILQNTSSMFTLIFTSFVKKHSLHNNNVKKIYGGKSDGKIFEKLKVFPFFSDWEPWSAL